MPISLTGHNARNDATTPLALDLTDSAVTLFARTQDDGWAEVATVATDAPDFLQGIADLRTEARIRDEKDQPITLWLPPEQVLVRHYELTGPGADARQNAHQRMAAETPYAASELMFAVSTYREGSPSTVLGALSQTVHEARDYARNWGFVPGPVSTRVAEEDFGIVPAIFHGPEPASLRVARRTAVFSMAAGVIGGALLGIYGLSQMAEPLVAPKVEKAQSGLVFAMLQVEDDLPPFVASPLSPVGKGRAQTLGVQRTPAVGVADDRALTERLELPFHMTGTPALRMPKTRHGFQVGTAPEPPARVRPGRLEASLVPPQRKPVDLARSDLDVMRAEGRDQAKLEGDQPAQVEVASASAHAGSLVAAALPAAILPSPENRPATQDENEIASEPPAVEPETDVLAPTALAPVQTEITPRRRPGDITKETQTIASGLDAQGDVPQPSATASLAVPPNKPEALISAEPQEAEDDDSPTRFAALSAPTPLTRPKSLERQPVLRQPANVVARDNAPRSVRSAAAQRGLAMGETNLIGVLQGSNGRQALVRLRDGGYLRVSRGDEVDGWRVRSIGRETLRLSRRGQNRTLMLVSR